MGSRRNCRETGRADWEVAAGGWPKTNRREGEREGKVREGVEINRVAIPPSSKSEAESFHCLRYLSR